MWINGGPVRFVIWKQARAGTVFACAGAAIAARALTALACWDYTNGDAVLAAYLGLAAPHRAAQWRTFVQHAAAPGAAAVAAARQEPSTGKNDPPDLFPNVARTIAAHQDALLAAVASAALLRAAGLAEAATRRMTLSSPGRFVDGGYHHARAVARTRACMPARAHACAGRQVGTGTLRGTTSKHCLGCTALASRLRSRPMAEMEETVETASASALTSPSRWSHGAAQHVRFVPR